MSTDEMTSIQALERKYPTLPMKPGYVARVEFEYICHGTQTLMANLNIATDQIVAPSIDPTRTEDDFVAHIAQTVATDPRPVGHLLPITSILINPRRLLSSWLSTVTCPTTWALKKTWHPAFNGLSFFFSG